jgi:hypothetical protein
MSGSSSAKGSSPRVARAPDRMAEAERRLLAGEAGRACSRQVMLQRLQLLHLVALGQRVVEFVGHVEMVFDHALVAAGDEDEVLDAGGARLVHDMLDDRTVDDGQHLLRDRLGGGRKRVPRPATGRTALRMRFVMQNPLGAIALRSQAMVGDGRTTVMVAGHQAY